MITKQPDTGEPPGGWAVTRMPASRHRSSSGTWKRHTCVTSRSPRARRKSSTSPTTAAGWCHGGRCWCRWLLRTAAQCTGAPCPTMLTMTDIMMRWQWNSFQVKMVSRMMTVIIWSSREAGSRVVRALVSELRGVVIRYHNFQRLDNNYQLL